MKKDDTGRPKTGSQSPMEEEGGRMTVQPGTTLRDELGQFDHAAVRRFIKGVTKRLARSSRWKSLDLSGIVQQTWLKVSRAGLPPTVQTDRQFRAYLKTAALRTMQDEARAKHHHVEQPLDSSIEQMTCVTDSPLHTTQR